MRLPTRGGRYLQCRGQSEPVRQRDRVGESRSTVQIGHAGEVLTVGVQQLKAEQPDRHIPCGLGDSMLAAPEHDLLEWAQLAGRCVVRHHFALQDRLARTQPGLQQLDYVGELAACPLLSAGEQLNPAISSAVCLDPHAVVLVLSHATPTQPGENLDRRRKVAEPA